MIGAARMFAPRMFAPRYWMKVGEDSAPVVLAVHSGGMHGGGSGGNKGVGGIDGPIEVYIQVRSKKRSAGGLGPRRLKLIKVPDPGDL